MWEILKSWRKGNKLSDNAGSSSFVDGACSPVHRNFSATVNFKDLNICVDEHDDDASSDSQEAPPAHSDSTLACPSPRAMKLRRLERNKLIIIMVGLPGRGKTFLCNKLVCYLNWLDHHTKLYNVGSYRRKQKDEGEVQDAAFFDQRNPAGMEARRRALEAALDDLRLYLHSEEGQVAIFDATNTTDERRQYLISQFHGRYQYLFIESICTDKDVLEQNYRYKMKYSPDYKGMSEEDALRDFKERIRRYEEVYEPLEDRTRHYIKLINMVTGRGHMDINRISGYIPGKIVFFLMQVCKAGMAQERKIWLTRHGESLFNLEGKIGGNAELSELGREYAQALPDVLMTRLPFSRVDEPVQVSVWTSTLRRTIETAEFLPFPKLRWKALDEIHAGSCDGLTYEEIAQQFPDEYEARRRDKLRYRYPAGESYLDVIQRLEPVIIELERERECVCVVAHQAVLRAIFGYFTAARLEDIPTVEVPLHSLIELKPRPDGTMQVQVVKVLSDPGTGLHPSLPPPTHPEHQKLAQQAPRGAAGAGASKRGSAPDFWEGRPSLSNTSNTDNATTDNDNYGNNGNNVSGQPAAGLSEPPLTSAGGEAAASSIPPLSIPPAAAHHNLVFPVLTNLRVSSPVYAANAVGAGDSGTHAHHPPQGPFAYKLPIHPAHVPTHVRSNSHAGSGIIHVGSLGDVFASCSGGLASAGSSVTDNSATAATAASRIAAAACGPTDNERLLVGDGDERS